MFIVIDGTEKSGASRGRISAAIPAEIVRLAKVAKGLAKNSAAVRNGSTVYRNEDGSARKFDTQKEAQNCYQRIYTTAKKSADFSHLAPHVFKVTDAELYVYVTDKSIGSVYPDMRKGA